MKELKYLNVVTKGEIHEREYILKPIQGSLYYEVPLLI